MHLATGEGVRRDRKKAIALYRRSAAQADAIAMYNLGRCYRDGRGVRREFDIAYEWFERAARHGDEDAVDEMLDLIDDKRVRRSRAWPLSRLRELAASGMPRRRSISACAASTAKACRAIGQRR
ncbi:MAG: tetratricopeptide repeat protein [Planctomycetota bacterium]